ncbi:MAG: aldo/keto reductase family protein [Pseudobdellovibrionaceae bacterium]
MFHPNMPYRSVGSSGLKVSALALGGWTTYGGTVKDQSLVSDIIQKAYDAGINYFDIADIYAKGESEKIMGECLSKYPRHHLVLATKVFWPMSDDINDRGLSRKHIYESLHKSLKRMKTDYVDLYFCHRYDPETPLEETIRMMDDLIHQGKVLYWGTSEWSAEQIDEALRICERYGFYKPIVEQPQLSLLAKDKFFEDTQPCALRNELGLVTWSPLASGMLTGKYDQGITQGRLSKMDWVKETFYTESNVTKVKDFRNIAEDLKCSRSQLAISWVLNQKAVSSVILGATSIQQLEENLNSLRVPFSFDIDTKLKKLF